MKGTKGNEERKEREQELKKNKKVNLFGEQTR